MKNIFLFILLFCISISAQTYKKISINLSSKADITTLMELGIVDKAPVFYKNKSSLQVFVNEKQLQDLNETGLVYSVLINDWQKYYNSLPQMTDAEKDASLAKSRQIYGVKDFGFGSMGGYLTADEVYAKLDEMFQSYSNIITEKDSIGATLLGEPIYAVKISDNPNINEDEPEVFYNSLIHAREPEGMMQLLYFMYYLLDNYGTDPEVTYLVNNRQLYFVPIFNVDGYKYNESTNPNGGGMWRKNRRLNSDGSKGVDLNRNWGYNWGYDNTGSSPNPSSETYRGTAAFSEPETETIRQFCISHNFNTALNYHTYSDLLILPWGYVPHETPDSLLYREFASEMTQYNHYTWGTSSDIIYSVNGDSDDWMYGEQTEKNKMIIMTPEVGTSSDGFWPLQSRILPLAEENIFPNLYIAWAAGDFVKVDSYGFDREYVNPGETTKLGVKVKNKGLSNASNVIVDISSLSSFVSVPKFPITIDTLSARNSFIPSDSLVLTISPNAPIGEIQHLLATININGQTVRSDTISFIVGTPKVIFEDSTSTITTDWTIQSNSSQKWNATSSTFVSSPNSYTDSKTGDYNSDIDNKLLLTNPIDLTGANKPFLTFQTKWDIESGWDAARVSVSTNSGSTWIDLTGKYTKSAVGQGVQYPTGAPIYDGSQNTWVKEMMDLSAFENQQIKIRFQIESDSYVEGDGWFIDDIAVMDYDSLTVGVEYDNQPFKFLLKQNYPNPFNPSTTINYSLSKAGQVTLQVFDILGRQIVELVNSKQIAGNYEVVFSADNLPSGIYYYKLSAGGNFVQTRKMILLK